METTASPQDPTGRVVIVGGGHPGAAAAAALRQRAWTGPITLVCAEGHAPYQRPPLSKAYLNGELDAERLALRPDAFWDAQGVDLLLKAPVAALDRDAKRVRLKSGGALSYDVCVLATGATPKRFKGLAPKKDRIVELRTRAHADALDRVLTRSKSVIVIGGGYIGLEAAASAVKRGLKVTVLEGAPRLLSRVAGPTVAGFFADVHRANGVSVRTAALCRSAKANATRDGVTVTLADGETLTADAALVGVGVRAADDLANASGLPCADGVLTDMAGRTTDPAVFALGAVARMAPPLYDRPGRLEAVQNANDMAKALAAALTGAAAPAVAAPWNWSDQYDVKLQTAGLVQGGEEEVVRGDPACGAFAVFYLSDGVLTACDGVNDPASFLAARKLIAQRAQIAPALLCDTSQALTAAARAA